MRNLLLFILVTGLTGCGQMGPLYLPPEATVPAANTQAPAEPVSP